MRKALLCILLLAGCTSHVKTYNHWTIPGGNQLQMNADWFNCVRSNTPRETVVEMRGNMVHVEPVTDVDQVGANQCMMTKGYTLTGSDTTETPN